MNLADDGVSGDAAAQLFGDLAGRLTLQPQFRQRADAVFIGTSLGGLVTMVIAASDQERIAGAMLNDIGRSVRGSRVLVLGVSYKTLLNKIKECGISR